MNFIVEQITSPAFGGRSFGTVGTYDHLRGTARVVVDARRPENAGIVDIDRVADSATGQVSLDVPVEILKPSDPARASGTLLYEVVNRGNKAVLVLLDDRTGEAGFDRPEGAGNGFLMEQGATLAWSGWQGDVTTSPTALGLEVPVAVGTRGPVRLLFPFDHDRNPASADLPYPAVAGEPARLTVRQYPDDPPQTPPDLRFRFESPTRITIERPATGFDAGALYEFSYTARDSKVMGLGFAAIRDVAAYLRDGRGPGHPAPGLRRVLGIGLSQSGRVLRDFLYQGFNRTQTGGRVFDGLFIHIAGARRSFVNARFAEPGQSALQHEETLLPLDAFPFAYEASRDPATGRRDGLLERCRADGTCPKILHVDTSTEMVQSRAPLVVTDPAGGPLALPPEVRAYLIAGVSHFVPANADPAEVPDPCLAPQNPLHAGPVARALFTALEAWVGEDRPPPLSRYPNLADGSLVPAERAAFPRIPGFAYDGRLARAYAVDDVVPPRKVFAYPALAPLRDADGVEVAGVRLPAVEAARASHLGFNLRRAGHAPGDLCATAGAALPFPATPAERAATGDPRLSLAERYPSPAARRARWDEAVATLARDGSLLPAEAERMRRDGPRDQP
ncbi:MAG TPA: alpha/beta hydrolase domain-containing protein [Beijerinckiaceae bacterium]